MAVKAQFVHHFCFFSMLFSRRHVYLTSVYLLVGPPTPFPIVLESVGHVQPNWREKISIFKVSTFVKISLLLMRKKPDASVLSDVAV